MPSFRLESGVQLTNVPVAYTTRGQLSEKRNNALVICHALSGSADVADWWGPLLGGPGQAFDISRFFVVCLNSLGSPYGSASPVNYKSGDAQQGRFGPEFPLTTIRDDARFAPHFDPVQANPFLTLNRIQRIVLDSLGVRQIACVIGGSMGGMLVLEYAYFGSEYVRSIAPIATSATHSAWGISWGEAQRQSIYSDPKYEDGYYSFDDPPITGLGAARMAALLTYRSRDSFEARFGRNIPDISKQQSITRENNRSDTPPNEHWTIHNHGHKLGKGPRPASRDGVLTDSPSKENNSSRRSVSIADPQFHGAIPISVPENDRDTTSTTSHYFSAQSYLRYQGNKFVNRFDANCYIAITRKLDTHDVSRDRTSTVREALEKIEQPTIVLGIESDGLFTFAEQQELAQYIPNARLQRIESPEGHDAFLLQFEQVNRYLLDFFRDVLPDIMTRPGEDPAVVEASVGQMTKSSTFGEAEVGDMTAW